MNKNQDPNAIAQINQILRESEEDGSYGGTFEELETRFLDDLKDARKYGDDRICIKLGVEVVFPIALVEAANPQEARFPTGF